MYIMDWIVKEKCGTPELLDEKMVAYYGQNSAWKFNLSECKSYKTGAMGRMTELGLLERKWDRRSVTYSITKKGKEYMEAKNNE